MNYSLPLYIFFLLISTYRTLFVWHFLSSPFHVLFIFIDEILFILQIEVPATKPLILERL